MESNELFQINESEFIEYANQISIDLANFKKIHGKKRDYYKSKIQKNIEKAQQSIREMDLEANSTTNFQLREDFKKRVKNFKKELEKFEKELSKSNEDETKYDLMGGNNKYEEDGELSTNEQYREKLIDSSKTLDNSGQKIESSIRVLQDTVDLGIDTSSTLKSQGDQIVGQIDKVRNIQGKVKEGGRSVWRMSRRQITNRLIIGIVICALLLIILVILFFIFRSPIFAVIDFMIGLFKKEEKKP